MHRLLRPLLILIALVFLFEAWLWRRLAPLVAWTITRIPLRRLKAAIAVRIDALPPAATLVVFVVPVLVLVPFKFLGLWLLAAGRWLEAVVVLALAKVVRRRCHSVHFRCAAPQAHAARLVSRALRARDGVARLGARID